MFEEPGEEVQPGHQWKTKPTENINTLAQEAETIPLRR